MATTQETHAFQAEAKELLHLVIHSLYSHKEIFLRELVSNASDACDKLRVEALTQPELLAGDDELRIQLEVDKDARTLSIVDNGIGMSLEELSTNLGTIAKSGTKAFAQQMAEVKEAADKDPEAVPRLIGQFGVGFYSAFMVADKVVVESRRAGADTAGRWTSEGLGEYTVEECDKAERGTRITLHLKPEDDGDERFQDFTEEYELREIVTRWSDFVEYPIQMEVTRWEGEDDDRKEVTKLETLNSQKPLWTRKKSEITDDEYDDFYKHVAKDWDAPLARVHFRAEGVHSYTALCYLPKKKQGELFDPQNMASKVQLYVRRVHISSECPDLLPSWLRFVSGVVDSDDLPLNVSRETLQHNRQLKAIQKRLTKKLLDELAKVQKERPADYVSFWGEFGQVLKEGIWHDDGHKEDLAKLLLFPSTVSLEAEKAAETGGLTSLSEYVERMEEGQDKIWFLSGADEKALRSSPHLERARGQEVLFFTEIDEVAMSKLQDFQGHELVALDRGDADDALDKEAVEKAEKEYAKLVKAIKKELSEHVSDVRFTTRLTSSAACLVPGEGELPAELAIMLRAQGQPVPEVKKVLELNPAHELVQGLDARRKGKTFGETCELLFGQAVLAEGGQLPDPARFAELVSKRLLD